MRLPLSAKVTMIYGSICGQAIMAGIDSSASIAVAIRPHGVKATIYQHTHFLRPAVNDDLRFTAQVKRFGKATAYVDVAVTFLGSGELVAHGVLEFAF
jgi:acyl-coenzyme A thioesterase PaaI-like protein